MNSTRPRLPTFSAPLSSSTRGSPSEYWSSLEMSSEPMSTEVSWLFGSTGGTTPIPADRTQIAFDMDAQHLFEFAAKMARDEVQRLLVHRAALNRINWVQLLKPTLNPFNQGAFARTDRAHQIEHLPAFLAF